MLNILPPFLSTLNKIEVHYDRFMAKSSWENWCAKNEFYYVVKGNVCIYPNLLPKQDVTQGQFFSRV